MGGSKGRSSFPGFLFGALLLGGGWGASRAGVATEGDRTPRGAVSDHAVWTGEECPDVSTYGSPYSDGWHRARDFPFAQEKFETEREGLWRNVAWEADVDAALERAGGIGRPVFLLVFTRYLGDPTVPDT